MKWLDAPWEGALDLLRLATLPSTRELVPITTLLREARALVHEQARERGLAIVVVGLDDAVFVPRRDVVLVAGALLARALRAAPECARLAITAQDFEDELVFAVYDKSAPRPARLRATDFVCEAAALLGGRVWAAPLDHGNLTLFAVPLYLHVN